MWPPDTCLQDFADIPPISGATKYRDVRGADILHMIAYENAIAPFAEFTDRVFECIKEVPLLRVLTDEEYNNLPSYWHARLGFTSFAVCYRTVHGHKQVRL